MEPTTLGDVKPLVYAVGTKPRGCFRTPSKKFIDIAPGDDTRYQTRGYPPNFALTQAPPVGFAFAGDVSLWKKLWPVLGALKRAWEYPAFLAKFKIDAIAYLISVGGVNTAPIVRADLDSMMDLAGRPVGGPRVGTLGASPTMRAVAIWAGMSGAQFDAIDISGVNGDRQAQSVIFFLVWRLHQFFPANIECK